MTVGLGLSRNRLGGSAAARTFITDTSLTSGTWNEPSGDYWSPSGTAGAVRAECRGAGGGATTATAGGGGGAYAADDVAPGGNVSVTVGTSAANTNGGDSSFGASVVAKGGLSGTNGGTGGTAAASTGTTKHSGGDGLVGAGNTTGGGGAGSTADGSGANGGAENGGFSVAQNAGRLIGCGGGGSGSTQQAGAQGEVRVNYYVEPTEGFPIVLGCTVEHRLPGTAHTVTIPSGKPGDLIVVLVFAGNNGTLSISGSAYTQVGSQVAGGSNLCCAALFHRTATGSDAAQVDITQSEEVAIYVWRLRNAAAPVWATLSGSAANANPPSLDTGVSARYLWIAAAGWDANIPTGATAIPANYGSLRRSFPHHSSSRLVAAACERFREIQTEDPPAFTSASEQFIAVTIAVPPPT